MPQTATQPGQEPSARLPKLPSMAVETFTIREAAKRCGVTYQAMRKRVDRDTLQTVKREGVRRIPRSELERTGLWPGSTTSDAELRAENERLRPEPETHRVLTERAQGAEAAEREAREHAEQGAMKDRAERQVAEQRAESLTTEAEAIANAGPIRALRLRKQLRQKLQDAA